jgi:hypothetical protein
MTQRDVEGTLGRLLTDPAFRVRFFTHPTATAAHEGLDLTAQELAHLERMPIGAVLEFASHVDGSLRRYAPPEGRRPNTF